MDITKIDHITNQAFIQPTPCPHSPVGDTQPIYGRFDKGRLRCEEAADLLGMSLSSFRRRRRRFEDEGLEGLVDRRLGKASARRVPVDEVTRMLL